MNVRAVEQLQRLSEQKRDKLSAIYQQQRQQVDNYQQQLQLLSQLKQHYTGTEQTYGVTMNSAMLTNSNQLTSQLTTMIDHHQHEQAIMSAECDHSAQQLQASNQQVKRFEEVKKRWLAKQQYEQARKEQKQLEELINLRHKKRKI
ncbi:flagellar export protein FliJ [Photobacterium leiognathi subsp. mandapamensis]|uniref:flagellar export protein FliJ n=1 Tax=Photobacterium leiognathi TaxID=553611 RepID=UPI002981F1FD|nr:flagellar export protein FliJ [Photobacterium leiognathi]